MYSEAFIKFVDLLKVLGYKKIDELPEKKIIIKLNDIWSVGISADGQSELTTEDGMAVNTPEPGIIYVWRNNWVAGMIAANGGSIYAEGEDELIKALEDKIEKVKDKNQ